MQQQVDRVFDPAHLRSITSRPFRFIRLEMRALIEIVDVVSEIVMEHPGVGRDTGLERQGNVVNAVHPQRLKSVEMLVMVVDRRNEHTGDSKWDDTQRGDPGWRKKKDRHMQTQHDAHHGHCTAIDLVTQPSARLGFGLGLDFDGCD